MSGGDSKIGISSKETMVGCCTLVQFEDMMVRAREASGLLPVSGSPQRNALAALAVGGVDGFARGNVSIEMLLSSGVNDDLELFASRSVGNIPMDGEPNEVPLRPDDAKYHIVKDGLVRAVDVSGTVCLILDAQDHVSLAKYLIAQQPNSYAELPLSVAYRIVCEVLGVEPALKLEVVAQIGNQMSEEAFEALKARLYGNNNE